MGTVRVACLPWRVLGHRTPSFRALLLWVGLLCRVVCLEVALPTAQHPSPYTLGGRASSGLCQLAEGEGETVDGESWHLPTQPLAKHPMCQAQWWALRGQGK